MPPVFDIQLIEGPVKFDELPTFPREAGGECVFLGRTRQEMHAKHGELVQLNYEAYEPMAVSTLQALAAQAVENFGCLAVRIHHAVGRVPIGRASVLVQVACAHRGASFDACRFLIDRLKAEAPIWKREVWADGTTWSQGQPVDSQAQS